MVEGERTEVLQPLRGGQPERMASAVRGLSGVVADVFDALLKLPDSECTIHATADECVGSLLVVALAKRGYIVAASAAPARMIVASVTAGAGLGARA